MTFKILLSRSVQTPNSDKNWQTSCPLQTFVCNISRHLEFIIEQDHRLAATDDRLSYLSTRVVCRDTTCDLTSVPLTPAPSPITVIADIYPPVCVRVGSAADVHDGDFRGTCVWGGDKCPARRARVTHKRHLRF